MLFPDKLYFLRNSSAHSIANVRAMKMVKGLEGKTYEERLRALVVFSPEQSRPRGGLMAACSSLPRGAEGQALSSALWGQRQDPRERHGAGTGEGQAGG